jgi:predicted CopG family antitoxin
MTHTVVIKLRDEVYERIQRQAELDRASLSQWIVAALERQNTGESLERAEKADDPADIARQAARERFERHFGEVDLGYATGIDNADLDRDLAHQYAATHEAE